MLFDILKQNIQIIAPVFIFLNFISVRFLIEPDKRKELNILEKSIAYCVSGFIFFFPAAFLASIAAFRKNK